MGLCYFCFTCYYFCLLYHSLVAPQKLTSVGQIWHVLLFNIVPRIIGWILIFLAIAGVLHQLSVGTLRR